MLKTNNDTEQFMDNFVNREPGICVFAEAMAEKLGGPADQYKPFLAACALSVSAVMALEVLKSAHVYAHVSNELSLNDIHASIEACDHLLGVAVEMAKQAGVEDMFENAKKFIPDAQANLQK